MAVQCPNSIFGDFKSPWHRTADYLLQVLSSKLPQMGSLATDRKQHLAKRRPTVAIDFQEMGPWVVTQSV
jgi:hypothetical protein